MNAEEIQKLFDLFVDADQAVRDIQQEILNANGRFQTAVKNRDQAWEKYRQSKKEAGIL